MDDDTDTEQTEFTFDQLDEHAKEVAREAWRAHALDDEWWEYTYEDAVRIGALIGIEIGSRSYKAMNGKTYQEHDINFEIGVGACFNGTLHIADLNGCDARLSQEIGDRSDGDKALHDLATEGQELYNQVRLRVFTRRLMGKRGDDDEDDELNEIGLDDDLPIEGEDRAYRSALVVKYISYPYELEQAANDFVSGFADWLHGQLELESEYRYSDEFVDEEIRANEVLFDEDGHEV